MNISVRRVLTSTSFMLLALAIAPSAQQAGAPPAGAPQQPSLTFRSVANYVELDALVTDAAGNPVRDLTCGDFAVVEDGRPQNLSVCSFVDIPVERADARPVTGRAQPIVEPDVVTNEKTVDGRVFMIVLDGLHVAMDRSSLVRRHAEMFIDRYLGSNDLAAIVQVGRGADGQEFTGSKRLLKASIARFTGQGLPSETQSINADALLKDSLICETCGHPILDVGPPQDGHAVVREFQARESLDVVRRASDSMSALKGRRKALLLFSEGIGIATLQAPHNVGEMGAMFENMPADGQSTRAMEEKMIAAATRSNVSIYTIDPRGLTTGRDEIPLFGPMATEPHEGQRTRDYSNPRMAEDMLEEVRRGQDSLRLFAEETGGLAMVDKNDMDDVFNRIVRDNSSYYVLGYQSPDPRHDGRYHRLSVKVNRPGAIVRTRNGYYAPPATSSRLAKPADPIVDMLQSPAPIGGLGMRANASVIKGLLVKSTVHLTVEFSGKDIGLKNAGNVFTNEIDVEYLALDMKGGVQANVRDTAHLKLKPATRDALPQTGVRYVTDFDLAPGRYQVRIAAREQVGGQLGSVFCDVDVPDVGAPPLAMSDILITTSSADRAATGRYTSTIGGILPTPTTTARDFASSDTVTVAAAMYDNDVAHPHGVDLKATVRTEDGTQVFLREAQKDGRDCATAKGGYRWVVPVPLKGLAPGGYVLAIEGRSALGGDSVKKEIAFKIR
jgi:VWFA-related protein